MTSFEQGPPAIDSALWTDFLAGSRLACARLISLVENEPASVPEIRDRLRRFRDEQTRAVESQTIP